MSSSTGPHRDRRRRDAARPRPGASRVPPRVEALEPRLLLSGPDLATTGLEGRGPGTGALVQEVAPPHDSPASAQPLPAGDDVGVIGTLQSDEAIDRYRISVAPGAAGVRLELALDPDASAARFQVLGDADQVLADLPLTGGSVTAVVLTPGWDIAPDSTLDAAVLRGPGAETAAPGPISYRLRVTRLEVQPLSLASSDPAPTALDSATLDSPPAVPPPAPPAPRGEGDRAELGNVPRSARSETPPAPGPIVTVPAPSAEPLGAPAGQIPVLSPPPGDQGRADPGTAQGPIAPATSPSPAAPIATAPLPTSPSRPAGGVFAVGGPIPAVSRREATRVDRALIDVRPRGLLSSGVRSEGRRSIAATRRDGDRSDPPSPRGALSPLEIALNVLEDGVPPRDAPDPVAARPSPELAVGVEDVPILPRSVLPVAVAIVPVAEPEAILGVPGPAPALLAGAAATEPEGRDPLEEDRPRGQLPRASVLIGANSSAAMAFGLLWGSDLVVSRHRLARVRPRRRPVR